MADRVVVTEGGSRWQAESGQYLLAFEGDPADGSLERDRARARRRAALEQRRRLVRTRRRRSRAHGRRRPRWRRTSTPSPPIPAFLDAHINLGRLLHEAGRFAKAERVYRDAIEACGNDPVLLYNLGVLLDDMDRKPEAVDAYEAALRGDPDLADCHYNLALLYEKLAQAEGRDPAHGAVSQLIGARSK